MIEAIGVGLTYPDGTTALKGIDLQIASGEVVYITGPSGSGKTSLLKLLMGMEYPTEGSLKVLGQAIAEGQESGIRKLRQVIGPVFQEFKLIRGRTAMENVMLGLRFLDFTPGKAKQRAYEALVKVGLEHKAFSPVENLSWGQCQRVAIARAIARKPVLILADEPTGNLDRENAINILNLLTEAKEKETTVLITTHATHFIEGKKNSMLIRMYRGNICCERLG
ncbi:MAG: ATP-binding cassette domain-containing protein [Clostridiaceae bacterium]|nr:ATP-binding cassette domain-containing protein [Clostridiaceae bacterium]